MNRAALAVLFLAMQVQAQYGRDPGIYGRRLPYGRSLAGQGKAAVLEGWGEKRDVAISGSTGGDVSGYTVRVRVDFETAMRSGFRDVRFTDQAATVLPQFLETVVLEDSAVFWVKVPSIPSTGTAIWMWFDNDTCQADVSSGSAFLAYDGFDDQEIDTDLWTVGSATRMEETADGYLHITQGDFNDIYLCWNGGRFGAGYAWRARAMYGSSNWVRESHIGFITARGIRSTGVAGASALSVQNQGTPDFRWRTDLNNTFTETNLNVTEVADTWYTFEARVHQDGDSAMYYFDETLNATITTNVPQADTLAFQILSYNWTYGKTWQDWYDWVWVRKYVEPEPVATVEH